MVGRKSCVGAEVEDLFTWIEAFVTNSSPYGFTANFVLRLPKFSSPFE